MGRTEGDEKCKQGSPNHRSLFLFLRSLIPLLSQSQNRTPAVTVYLRSLFMRAVSRHTQYAAWAADGQGVDRHLLSVKEARANRCQLSTSQRSNPFFGGWGNEEG